MTIARFNELMKTNEEQFLPFAELKRLEVGKIAVNLKDGPWGVWTY
jgi:hypothetical protein